MQSTVVAAQPPNVFFPPPTMGTSSSHVQASLLYAFQERKNTSLTASLRSRVTLSILLEPNLCWTLERVFGFPLGSVARGDSNGKNSGANVQLYVDGLKSSCLCRVGGYLEGKLESTEVRLLRKSSVTKNKAMGTG